MKKSILIITLAMASVSLYAGKFNIGVEAGYDFSHYRSKTTTTTYNGNQKIVEEEYQHAKVIDETVKYYENDKEVRKDKKSTSTGRLPQMHGFHVGPTFDWRFSDRMGLGLRFALDYQFLSTAGGIYDTKDERKDLKDNDIKAHTYYHALNLPIRLSYTFNLPQDWHIWVMTGPKFDIGLSFKGKATVGNRTDEVDYFSGKTKTTIGGKTIEEEDEYLKYDRFNCSWGVGFGVGYKNFNFSAVYDFGLSRNNVLHEQNFGAAKSEYANYNNQLQLTLSYTFPVKK
ncbi:MAG: PorT family protein [Paludibacteraceae bacterium]|nr:PorT family protein [Paludibacteraceae bacterium]